MLPSLLTDLLVISIVAVAVKYVRLPYTIALVCSGLTLGALRPYLSLPLDLQLTSDLLFFGLLPPLLFEGSLNVPLDHLREQLKPILSLATLGLLVSTLLVGWGLQALSGLPLPACLVFGALISSTDPISVLALFRELKAPKKLSILVEGESLFNDGVAAVLFTVFLSWKVGQGFSLLEACAHFLFEAGGGVAVGLFFGYLAWVLARRLDDHLIEITLSTILAYGSYLIAHRLHVSGVIAVIVAGIFYGNFILNQGLSRSVQVMLTGFWEYAGFLGNSLVFLLIGTQIDLTSMIQDSKIGLALFALVLIARLIAILILLPALPRNRSWLIALHWGGLRGSIAIALAMAITLPERDLLLRYTFMVVLLSLLVQGLTMKPLLRLLGLIGGGENLLQYELKLGDLIAAERGLAELQARKQRYHFSDQVYTELATPLQEKIENLRAALGEQLLTPDLLEEQRQDAIRMLRGAQLSGLREALSQGLVGEESYSILRDQLFAEASNEPEQGGG